ncbi:hypothetical protein DUT91_16930 [Phyllobacterium salinisoli]|uniref:Uncharacterized protein n=1 Tax=Phyllobacterium salinisoli TaxID=1899321 RepID=A0A368K3K5_9HYPH|nr:hypothetical protein DUT91_16930 [Phyllobacterium salinisoli]
MPPVRPRMTAYLPLFTPFRRLSRRCKRLERREKIVRIKRARIIFDQFSQITRLGDYITKIRYRRHH